MTSKIPSLILAVFVTVSSYSQVQIQLTGDNFAFDAQPEGALTLPNRRGEAQEVLRGPVPLLSEDGTVNYSRGGKISGNWEISKTIPGRYDFYVAVKEGGEDYRWTRKTKVTVFANGVSKTFSPEGKRGAVWHVFSLEGGTDEIEEVNRFLPAMRLIYGRVRDAATGKPLAGTPVTLLAPPSWGIVAQTVTDDRGIYFLDAPPRRADFPRCDNW